MKCIANFLLTGMGRDVVSGGGWGGVIIGPGNDLLPIRHQAKTWSNNGLLWIEIRRKSNQNQNKPFLKFPLQECAIISMC